MLDRYLQFIRRISVNRIGQLGVILTTSSFVTFIFLEILRMAGILTNSYIGLITYLVFPAVFILGLLLIPLAWIKYQRNRKKSAGELLTERFAEDLAPRPLGSRFVLTIAGLTLINVLFLSAASFRTLEFMDSARFCGTTCHTVMNPEWTTYQVSPHARVKCVECHVGEGVEALINSKLNGARQMILAMFDAYHRPIHTPVKQLRPARETCEKCHWPEKFYGQRLDIITHYLPDEFSTPSYTTLDLKIDTGKEATKAGIHWHIGSQNQVRYTSVGDKREEIIWAETRQPDGSFKRYQNSENFHDSSLGSQDIRIMDCVDCHNRATHIYEEPDAAIDSRIQKGLIPRSLPFIKREVLTAITFNSTTTLEADNKIAQHLIGFYSRKYPDMTPRQLQSLDTTIQVAQDILHRNLHHFMKIDWNTYPSFRNHHRNTGCFRCHNPDLKDPDGNHPSLNCTLCHSILAFQSSEPFAFLENFSSENPELKMQQYLRKEFILSRSTESPAAGDVDYYKSLSPDVPIGPFKPDIIP